MIIAINASIVSEDDRTFLQDVLYKPILGIYTSLLPQAVQSIRVFVNVDRFPRFISPLSHILSLNIRVANRVIIGRVYRQFSTIVRKLGGQFDDGTLTNVLLVLYRAIWYTIFEFVRVRGRIE